MFDVALLEGMFLFDSLADKEAEGFRSKYGGISLRFGPYAFFVITKDANARLGLEGQEVFIVLDG